MTAAANHDAYREAMRLLGEAAELAFAGRLMHAIGRFGLALRALGDRYSDLHVLDDSEMKVIVAEQYEKRGDLQAAAQLLEKVVEARLGMYRKKYGLRDERAKG
jgi:hypothetical protein